MLYHPHFFSHRFESVIWFFFNHLIILTIRDSKKTVSLSVCEYHWPWPHETDWNWPYLLWNWLILSSGNCIGEVQTVSLCHNWNFFPGSHALKATWWARKLGKLLVLGRKPQELDSTGQEFRIVSVWTELNRIPAVFLRQLDWWSKQRVLKLYPVSFQASLNILKTVIYIPQLYDH